MRWFESRLDLLEILQRCVLLEGVGELLRTHGTDLIVYEAAMKSKITMLSVAIDDSQIRK